jgi:hypothetical protein
MILLKERLMEIIPYLNDPIVKNLWDGLLLPVQPQTPSHCVVDWIDCDSIEIIRMLTKKYRGNLINSKQIIVTSTAAVYQHLAVVFNLSDHSLVTLAPPCNA